SRAIYGARCLHLHGALDGEQDAGIGSGAGRAADSEEHSGPDGLHLGGFERTGHDRDAHGSLPEERREADCRGHEPARARGLPHHADGHGDSDGGDGGRGRRQGLRTRPGIFRVCRVYRFFLPFQIPLGSPQVPAAVDPAYTLFMATVPDLTLDAGLPANLDAEKTILGAILLDNAFHAEAAEVLTPDDFA